MYYSTLCFKSTELTFLLYCTDQSDTDRKEVSTAFVWYYNTSTEVAVVRDGFSKVCIGLDEKECSLEDDTLHSNGPPSLRVKGVYLFFLLVELHLHID